LAATKDLCRAQKVQASRVLLMILPGLIGT
jgi:hypothetical protein